MEVDDQNNENTSEILKSKCGILTRTDGSAICSQGGTTMLAGIYGPLETKLHKVLIDRAVVEAQFRPKSGLPGVQDRLYEKFVEDICETAILTTSYPRAGVDVIIQEMQNSGLALGCSLNAACLALIDSGIDMKFLFAAVTCSFDGGNFNVEPTNLQIEKAKATFVLTFDGLKGGILGSHTVGNFEVEEYKEAIRICRKASAEIFSYYRNLVTSRCK